MLGSRRWGQWHAVGDDCTACKALLSADKLREENARLRQRVEELEEMYSSLGRNYDSLEKRAEAAEAKVARWFFLN